MSTESTFDVFRSNDGTVSKYVHEDGSETAVKLVKSVQSILNPLTNKIETRESDRNKYSIFISSSVGCFMKCKFCHLTLKDSKYIKLSNEQVLKNIQEAIEDAVVFNPDMKNRYIKLSWMGMGDAFNKPGMVTYVTLRLLDWIFANGYAVGLDGVDLSTVIPDLRGNPEHIIWPYHELETNLKKYVINPIYSMDNVQFTNGFYSHKNIFRLFYSIGSAIQDKKEGVIPNAMSLENAAKFLTEYSHGGAFPVIFHHVLVDGLNDSDEELDALIGFMNDNFPESELRILRYNYCSKDSYKESEQITRQIRKLSDNIKFLKVQISPGTEVSAACGQFIVKDFVRKGTHTKENEQI